MPSLTQLKTLPYPAKKIYELVMDIEKYPQFLPWCKDARIVEKISANNLHADFLVNFKNFFESYRSDVKHGQNLDGSYFVDVVSIRGPFKKLVNQWQFFDDKNGGCEVKFFIEFEFNSLLLSKIASPIFERATEKMMTAFEGRAQQLFR